MIYSGSRLATFKYSLFQEKGFIYACLKHLLLLKSLFLTSTEKLALLIAVNKYKHEGEYILDGINPGSYISEEGKKKGAIPSGTGSLSETKLEPVHTYFIIIECLKNITFQLSKA